MMGKEAAVVYMTMDYNQFKRLVGNRDVTIRRKNRIKESIRNFGYILNPIVVNENMEIIDGQGRFEALRDLALPVYYVIADGAGVKECVAMNINMSNWKVIDYVNSYAELGNENYIRYKKLIEEHEDLTVDEVYGLIKNKIVTTGYGSREIKDGELYFTEDRLSQVSIVAEWLDDHNAVIDAIPGSRRVKRTGIAWVLQNTSTDWKRLGSKLSERYVLIPPVTDTKPDLFLSSLSDVYNHHLSAQKCIYYDTEYKKYLRGQE